jgi:hypothetical protein
MLHGSVPPAAGQCTRSLAALAPCRYDVYHLDFDGRDHAEKCISMYNQWKGWGPKGLMFNRIGTVMPDLKRPHPGVLTRQSMIARHVEHTP